MAGQAEKKWAKDRELWQQYLDMILAGINVCYLLSLVCTHFFRPAGPIFDLETDEIIGQNEGVTWKHLLMIVVFGVINYYLRERILKSVGLGVKPSMYIDIIGVNLFVQLLYCFTGWALYIYWIIPIFGIYKAVTFIGPFCCPRFFGGAMPEAEE